jgi:transposase-like protein/IS1 family transposase
MNPTCPTCETTCRKHGKTRDGLQRFRCGKCGVTYQGQREQLFAGFRIPEETALMALTMLCEGSSVRATCRITGLHKKTVLGLLVYAGERVERFMAERIKDVPVTDVECDEVWGFIGCKEKTKARKGIDDAQLGDSYAWIAVDRNTKLVLCHHVGRRTKLGADAFAEKLDSATAGTFQVSTDGFEPYVDALGYHVGGRSSYGQIIKEFGYNAEGERRYSPPKLIGSKKAEIFGKPEFDRIGTSRVERWNLSLRTGMKRMSRLTIAFSRCWRNHKAAMALWIGYYNFCRMHRSIKMTPAMKADVARAPWSMRELISAAVA